MKLLWARDINKSAKQVPRGNNQDELAYLETSLPSLTKNTATSSAPSTGGKAKLNCFGGY